MSTQVLLADDDVELSAMLKEYLEREGFAVTAVHDGEAAARLAPGGAYQIVVLDVMMPKLDGVEALRRIRQASRVPVIMLTARGDDVDRIVGLELGADDYVPKPCTPRELVARLRAILRRLQPQPDGGPLSVSGLVMWPEKRRVEWLGRSLELTGTEFNVLEVLMRNAGRVVSKKELSEQALGRPMARFDRSVDVHLSSVRQKLGRGSALIHTVRGIGYHLAKGWGACSGKSFSRSGSRWWRRRPAAAPRYGGTATRESRPSRSSRWGRRRCSPPTWRPPRSGTAASPPCANGWRRRAEYEGCASSPSMPPAAISSAGRCRKAPWRGRGSWPPNPRTRVPRKSSPRRAARAICCSFRIPRLRRPRRRCRCRRGC